MSYTYSPVYPVSADVAAVATQLAQRQSDAATTNGGITAAGGSAVVPQLGVDGPGLGMAYLKAIADATLCAVGYQGQDYQAATASTSSSLSFVDVGGFPSWSFTAPIAKTYLVHVDCTASLTGLTNGVLFWQVVNNGNAITPSQSFVFNSNLWALPMSFRVPVSMVAGTNVIKLQWKVNNASAVATTATTNFRCFTVTG